MVLTFHGADLNDEDRELSRQMMSYWTNFAKTGYAKNERLIISLEVLGEAG